MANPIVKLDLTNHPLYANDEYYNELARCFDAEVLMVNVNTGSMRVRLYDLADGSLVRSNFDTSMSYIVEDSFVVKVR